MTGEIPACPVGMADPRGLLAAAVAVARETIPLSRIDVSVGESRFRRFTSDRVVFEERQGEWFCSGRQIKFMDRSTLGVVAEAIGYAAAERISGNIRSTDGIGANEGASVDPESHADARRAARRPVVLCGSRMSVARKAESGGKRMLQKCGII